MPTVWAIEIASVPLYIGSTPTSVALVPSVEFPTIISQANSGPYLKDKEYTGYFDSNKCYLYVNAPLETNRHFKPVGKAVNKACTKDWSGNFLNWAVTQTIDPFRSALTGGYRVRDTPSETWLEKARHTTDNYVNFPNRTSSAQKTTPFTSWGTITIRVSNLKNKIYFSATGDVTSPKKVLPYPVNLTSADKAGVYEASIRVKVCDPAFPEKNCIRYGDNWKPEGLIQQYSSSLKFSIFGYLNDSHPLRDGGVLRARNKYVGNYKLDRRTNLQVTNNEREWDPNTGVFVRNPDSVDATATNANIRDSGVINYLNKFGQMTERHPKTYDPVSELYYSAIRYFKNLGNVASYSTLSGNSTQKYEQADGFPVITHWDDPIENWCQKNIILGIGDTNTSYDKNLPGNNVRTDEPATPTEVDQDKTVNVVTATKQVAKLEDITINTPFRGTSSAYMAGLAYDANTVDMRPEGSSSSNELLQRIKGKQTLSTYWVDVREFNTLANRANNQYWLASKYGGFKVPNNFKPYDNKLVSIPDSLWHTTGDILSNGDKRPDNFFVASDAQNMVSSLTKAFASINAERTSSAAALTSSSNKIEPGVAVFQTTFSSSNWSGDLKAYAINQSTQKPESPPLFSAASALPLPKARKIYFNRSSKAGTGEKAFFVYDSLNPTQKTMLKSENLVNYLRGDRTHEIPNGEFRARNSALGDIVNSTPIYVGNPNTRAHANKAGYAQFAKDNASRTPMVYVGGNDGMLHGFNAKTGVEVFAFIPSSVLNKQLASYASPDYSHQYFVDGEITVADVYISGHWKTILVANLGRGGRATFALDVTDPSNFKLLWEHNSQGTPGIGQVLGKPVIARVGHNRWSAIMGNGLNSADGNAQLIMIDIDSGKVTFIATDAQKNNGLSSADVWDTNGDGIHDTVYAGDQRGRLWKFSNLNDNAPRVKRLFTTNRDENQAISATPIAMFNPKTKQRWVFFGTGRLLNANDLSNKDVQSWYGIIDTDKNVPINELVERKILKDSTTANGPVRVISKASANDMQDKLGWFMNLKSSGVTSEGERMLLPNQIQSNVLIGTSRIPDSSDPCLPEGRGYTMAIDPFSGASLEEGFFDLNGDGKIDENDKIDGNYASGVGFDSSPNAPIFVGDGMLSNLENSNISHTNTQGRTRRVMRTSWREILGD